MEKLDPKTDGSTADIVGQNTEKLKELFPEVFTDGNIDFDALRDILGSYVDDRQERYSFNWNGKALSRRIAQTPSTGTLRPCPEESIDWDSTRNLFIEGDNLEVLKLLQKSYHKKVKMIYIDPPYNTGKDFIYPDNFSDSIRTYMELTGQLDYEGRRMSANSETSGRYHTNWLNMMYPRLKLARNLLRDDGVMFISVDDVEAANLRKLCDEIFGEENLVGIFPWRSRTAKADVPFGVSVDVEWVVAYCKPLFIGGRTGERRYIKSDDYEDRWRLQDLTTNKTKEERPNSFFTMVNPQNGEKYPASPIRTWSVTKDTFLEYYEAGKIVFPGDYEFLNIKRPAFRVFESEDKKKALEKYGTEDVMMPVSTYLPENEVGRTEHGSKEIRELFGQQVFSYPKPTGLIKFFTDMTCDPNAIIVDFFAGSATTADAVQQQNLSDGGSRRYILIQLPQPLDPSSNEEKLAADYCESHNLPMRITELAKERLRLVHEKLKSERATRAEEIKAESQGMGNDLDKLDLGFKVFKLDSSNIKQWDADFDNLEGALLDTVENIKPDRSEMDILYELLLKYGLDLTEPIEERQIAGANIYIIGAGALIVSLGGSIGIEVVEGIAALKDELRPEVVRVVFRDTGFDNDVVKTNAIQVLRQVGINDVKSL